MEVKAYLAQIRKCEAMIQNRRDTIQQFHDEALRITPTSIDGMKVNATSSPDRRESLICDYLRMEQELEDEVRLYHVMRRDAIQLFEQLPLAQYDILYQVYILGRTLQDVAIKADRSYLGQAQHKTGHSKHCSSCLIKKKMPMLSNRKHGLNGQITDNSFFGILKMSLKIQKTPSFVLKHGVFLAGAQGLEP